MEGLVTMEPIPSLERKTTELNDLRRWMAAMSAQGLLGGSSLCDESTVSNQIGDLED
jgi:hypothetical protein